jgi:hypothetical protein
MKSFLFLIVVWALFLTGCTEQQRQFAIDSATVSASLVTLDHQFEHALAKIDRSVFSEEELVTLDKAVGDLQQLRQELKGLVKERGGVGMLLMDMQHASRLFAMGKQAYLDAKAVIVPHLTELTLADQLLLSDMERAAKRLDAAMVSITMAPEGTDITPYIRDALVIARSVAELAAAL